MTDQPTFSTNDIEAHKVLVVGATGGSGRAAAALIADGHHVSSSPATEVCSPRWFVRCCRPA